MRKGLIDTLDRLALEGEGEESERLEEEEPRLVSTMIGIERGGGFWVGNLLGEEEKEKTLEND